MAEPVNITCPDIDKVIKGIEDAEQLANKIHDNFEDKTISEIETAFDDIQDFLYGLVDIMNELRLANSALRDWGNCLETEINEMGD